MDLSNTVKVVQEYGMETITELSAALLTQGSQHLYSQLDAKTVVDVESILLTIKGPIGIYFASYGRSPGRFPPVESMRQYVKSHNIQFRNSKGQYLKDNSTAFLIGRKIATLGSKAKASRFLDQWKITQDLNDKVLLAFKEDLRIELLQMIDQFEASQS